MAWLSGVPERDRRGWEDAEALGTAEARHQEADLLRLWPSLRGDPRHQRTGSPRPAVLRISGISDGGTVPGALSRLRSEKRTGEAVAEQGAFQQAIRGCGGGGLRECLSPAGGAANGLGREHGTGNRFAVPGALGGRPAQASSASNGRR